MNEFNDNIQNQKSCSSHGQGGNKLTLVSAEALTMYLKDLKSVEWTLFTIHG